MRQLTEKQRRWQAIIEQWSQSGLTQASFCRDNNIDPNRFYSWKSKLASLDKPKNLSGAFVQVGRASSLHHSESIQLCLGSLKITYSHDTDQVLFTKLLKTLGVVNHD